MADELAGYLADQRTEWNTYVAAEPIDINGARAFNIGDAVPKSHVDRGVVRAEQVRDPRETAPGQPAVVHYVPPGTFDAPPDGE